MTKTLEYLQRIGSDNKPEQDINKRKKSKAKRNIGLTDFSL